MFSHFGSQTRLTPAPGTGSLSNNQLSIAHDFDSQGIAYCVPSLEDQCDIPCDSATARNNPDYEFRSDPENSVVK